VASAESLVIRVYGTPAPQGSKRAFVNKHSGRVQVVESSKAVKPWRQAVLYAALEERRRPGRPAHETLAGPVAVTVEFLLARPKGHYGTGRNAGLVKESAPGRPAVRPDLDKLVRSTLDALKEAGVYGDDSQIVALMATKFFSGGGVDSGAVIMVARV
jgi:Holliday junction resolvase RusA-like endonuclease